MLPENGIPTHPGEVLLEEFLAPLGVTQVAFARHIGVPVQRVSRGGRSEAKSSEEDGGPGRPAVNEIVRGKRGVTPETAWLFAQALGTTPELWLNLQAAHDLARLRPRDRLEPLAKVG